MRYHTLCLPFSLQYFVQSTQNPPLTSVMIELQNNALSSLHGFSSDEVDYLTRGARIVTMIELLENNTRDTHSPILKAIDEFEAERKDAAGSGMYLPSYTFTSSLWITNRLYIRNASEGLIAHLEKLSHVKSIRAEQVTQVPHAEDAQDSPPDTGSDWGLSANEASELRKKGLDGKNAVVGVIGSGVNVEHETLHENWRQTYGWMDATQESMRPYDDHGLGTHTLATIVGSSGIGVAPNAKWTACKSCVGTTCTEYAVLTCAQYMMCPYNAENKRDCEQAPNLVFNSWGYAHQLDVFEEVFLIWRYATIQTTLPSGDDGPQCISTQHIQMYDAITVGALSRRGELLSQSTYGITRNGQPKPDIVAPGEYIRSAWKDNSYKNLTGTFHAAARVAGAMTLVLGKLPGITHAELSDQILRAVSVKDLLPVKDICPVSTVMSNLSQPYGHGRLNLSELNLQPSA